MLAVRIAEPLFAKSGRKVAPGARKKMLDVGGNLNSHYVIYLFIYLFIYLLLFARIHNETITCKQAGGRTVRLTL